jgi:hypothetical protein
VAELERELRAVRVEWPPEPNLGPRVRARVVEAPPRLFPWRRTLVVALAVLAVAVAAAFAVPSARTAILRWLGLTHVKVVRVDRLPPTRRLSAADLGTRTTLADVARRAGFSPLVLRQRPDSVYVGLTGGGGSRVSFVYGEVSKPRLLLGEFRGVGVTKFVQKLAVPGTTVERVRVGGDPGLWIGGAPHAVYFAQPGSFQDIFVDEPLLAGNTLVWERPDGLTLRLEGDLDKDDALALAKSLRPLR